MNQTNKKVVAKAGKGRPTPSKNKTKAAANAAKSRKAANQWYAIIAVVALIIVAAVVLYSVFGNAEPYDPGNVRLTG